ncbi:MAG: hypothetical protein H7061_09640 [Bdellovibrionaceae bacterium]|nr:hypothetical protein [Bdellovibrio sp.]
MKKLFTKNTALIGLLILSTFAFSGKAQAYLSINETAELLPEGYFRFGVAPQIKLTDNIQNSNSTGFNLGAFFDYFIVDDLNGRLAVGGGSTDFWTQASVKWVPFPDVDRQPAMGLRGAVIYARDSDLDFYDFQVAPIISKVGDTRYGKMIAFAALPITFINTKNKSTTGTQFAVGGEWFSHEKFHFGVELDLNLSNSISAVSSFISFPFDSSIGYKR